MKLFLQFALLLTPFFAFGQKITYDTSKTWNGHLYWIGEHHLNGSGEKSWVRWTFYYENGQKRLEEITDTLFVSHKLVNGWLPDGTQILKSGNGFLFELERDSTVYEVNDSLYEGYCKSYRKYGRKGFQISPWKLYATGNFTKGIKTGEWICRDSSGATTVSFNYEDGIVRGKCTLYYSVAHTVKERGNIINCQKNGLWQSYDSTGTLLVECYYENGEKKGAYTSYYPNGKIKSKGQYKQVSKKYRIATEDPKSPGEFLRLNRTQTFTNVPAKTGIWNYYNESGELISSKKHKNDIEIPEYLEYWKVKKTTYYSVSRSLFFSIPDCNYR